VHALLLSAAGLGVGITVGMTGMGGGALMTPLLVLVFGVSPMTAVSSDLMASLAMKPLGALVHARRGTLHRGLIGWLCLGSVPAAFCGVLLLHALGAAGALQHRLGIAIGVALLVAVVSLSAKALLSHRRPRATEAVAGAVRIRALPTLAIGAFGGLLVGMTSVGSGSLMLVLLVLLYPALSAGQLVGTDLAQAIPLVAAAAAGHLLFGEVSFSLTGVLLIGALPGVYVGARLSAAAPDRLVRGALMVVLTLSALKLLGVPSDLLGWGIVALLPVGAGVVLAVRGSTKGRAGSMRCSTPGATGARNSAVAGEGGLEATVGAEPEPPCGVLRPGMAAARAEGASS
jgi:uncharacterized membrane protein YfcA